MNENIDLSHTKDPSSPNHSIHDIFILSNAKLMNVKSHSKLDAFQEMVNQKH